MFGNRDELVTSPGHALALDCLRAGIEAAHPKRVVADRVRVENDLAVEDLRVPLPAGDLLVVGGGKAAGTVAAALERALGDRIDGGVVVTDTPAPTERVRVREGTHPVPGERNANHTQEVLEIARSATADDLVLAVVTGGGSALLAAPSEGVNLADLRATTESLLNSGAAIGEINTVRKHLSTVKGGGLAQAAAPAPVVGLVFSDVIGNDPGTVASGPTAPDPTTYGGALDVLDRYNIAVPRAVRDRLEAGDRGEYPETPADPAAVGADNRVLADGLTALKAAAKEVAGRGYEPLILSSRVRGPARAAAATHVAVAEEIVASGHPVEPPAAVLSGGEVTVADPGGAVGGPNLEFGLAGALEIETGVLASVDTDGIDGSSPAAGALVDGDTIGDTAAAQAALDNHASYEFLSARDAAVETNPTGTNVNDLRVLIIGHEEADGNTPAD